MNLPNALTLLRILLVPVVIWLIADGHTRVAFYAFLLAGVTDGLDGYLARTLDQRTTLGAYLDALADKLLLVSIYVSLALFQELPRWVAILVVARDVMIVGAVMLSWVMERPVAIVPLFVSKANTVAQIVLAALVLAASGFELDLHDAIMLATVAVAALTSLSTAAYLVNWVRHMSDRETGATRER